MQKGTVKWFNTKRGYGFITDEQGQDVFVHYSDIVGDGFRTLEDGEQVTFDLSSNYKGKMAKNVVRMNAHD